MEVRRVRPAGQMVAFFVRARANMGELVPFPKRFSQTGEQWHGPMLDKKQLANHFGRSTRWVELRVNEGMPSEVRRGKRMFSLLQVQDWFLDKSA